MRIGFLVPTVFALDGPGNGVRAQALEQAAALRRLGHDVALMDPWRPHALGDLDVIQFFSGGASTWGIERFRRPAGQVLAFATMIDSNEPFWRYRLAAAAGCAVGRLQTVQGVLRQQAIGSDLVVVRSTHELARVRRGLGVRPTDRTRVQIVLNGVNPPPPGDAAAVRQRLGLPDRYALHVGTYTQDRKNVLRLVRAIAGLGVPLVLAGTAPPGPELEAIRAAATGSDVRFLGFQDAESLAGLYAGCHVFCLPSVHEGTGLAALEAATYGANVVITRNGGPPDYFGDMAEYVDPFDVESIRRAVRRAWGRPRSDALREHVLTRLTWDQSAKSLVEAYEATRAGM